MAAARAFDLKVRLVMSRLHDALGPRCFVSGSFVAQLAPASAVSTFVGDLAKYSSKRVVAKTHDDFQKPTKLAAHRLCGARCGAASTGDLRASPQREYSFSPPLAGLCGRANTTPKRVLLWYTFALGGDDYLFMKLETHPAASLAHVRGAVARYLLKRPKTSAWEPRRENAYKDTAKDVVARAAAHASVANAALWPAHAHAARAYDNKVRVGMELFVPGPLFAGLVG